MKRGQITIFMILGVLIFFIFLFLLQFSGSVRTSQLEVEQEKVVTTMFQREALQIYVQDCLRDELEQGILLIGKQGRLWDFQPGGRKNFQEGRTGTSFMASEQLGDYFTGNIFYGIVRDELLAFPSGYPCLNESNEPQFCRYSYPFSFSRFGSVQLRTSTIEEDLQRFLMNRTQECVADFLHTSISPAAILDRADFSLALNMHDEGIAVRANYPLQFHVGGEEFFHATAFDFFYPSHFKQLLDVVTVPLQFETKYVDFNYSQRTLEQNFFVYGTEKQGEDCIPLAGYFLCGRSLAGDLLRSLGLEVVNTTTASGDSIFIIRAPANVILEDQSYEYRFASQNRAPALDYIQHEACPSAGYDYLVIKEDENYGDIAIFAQARDPDEHNVTYSFISSMARDAVHDPSGFVVNEERISLMPEQQYDVLVNASDPYGQSDWQQVRILVDRSMTPGLRVELPYEDTPSLISGNRYRVSREDPVYVKLVLPARSADPTARAEGMSLTYDDGIFATTFGIPSRESISSSSCSGAGSGAGICYNVPLLLTREEGPLCCNLAAYDDEDFSSITERPLFNIVTASPGILRADYDINYCEDRHEEASTQVQVIVDDCVPHRNPKFPYPSPYHGYAFGVTSEGETDFTDFKGVVGETLEGDASPFDATHACCLGERDGDWSLASTDVSCYDDPLPGCFGFDPFGKEGFLLEKRTQYCSGNRGNICDGQWETELVVDAVSRQPLCGNMTGPSCDAAAIPDECEGKPAWSIHSGIGAATDTTSAGYWCYGGRAADPSGCEAKCGSFVVDANADSVLGNLGDTCGSCPADSSGSSARCLRLSDGAQGRCERGECVVG